MTNTLQSRVIGLLFVIMMYALWVLLVPSNEYTEEPKHFSKRLLDVQNNIPECEYEEVLLWPNKCDYFLTCKETSKIPYLKMHYCTLGNIRWFSFSIFIILLIFYFYLLGQLADSFFIPILSTISTALHLPSSVAGVTLLALGNGAPDIFSTYAAVQTNEYQQAFGQVIGASSFISIAITGVLSVGGFVDGFEVNRRPFLKDVGFLCIATCLVFYMVYDFEVAPWEPWMLLGLYLLFVVVTVIGRVVFQHRKRNRLQDVRDRLMQAGLSLPADHVIFKIDLDSIGISGNSDISGEIEKLTERQTFRKFKFINRVVEAIERNDMAALPILEEGEEEYEFKRQVLAKILDQMDVTFLAHVGFWKTGKTHKPKKETRPLLDVNNLILNDNLNIDLDVDPDVDLEVDPEVDLEVDPDDSASDLLVYTEEGDVHPWYVRLSHVMHWKPMSTMGKIFAAIKFPLLLVEHLTIPSAEKEYYFRPFYILQPLCIVPTVFYVVDIWNVRFNVRDTDLGPVIFWVLPVGAVLAVVVFFTTNNHRPPVYDPLYVFVGLIMSVLWINAVADELVLCLGGLGNLLGIPRAILGLTILAWGNSIGDLVSNVLVARKGFPGMAAAAIYSSPLTHMLLGLGISFAVKTAREGSVPLTVTGTSVDLTDSLYLNFLFLIAGLLFVLVAVPVARFQFTRVTGSVLLLVYVAGVVVGLLDVSGVIFDKIHFWTL